MLPVPAPATLNLLAAAGAPTTADTTPFELVTPTGAALLAGLARFERPTMRLERVGYGLGARELARPNALRVWLGTRDEGRGMRGAELSSLIPRPSSLVLLETNIDDQPAEQLAYACERLLALGALDVWATPIQMKKGRAGVLLSALVPGEIEAQAVATLMRETTTLGVRRRAVERHICEREVVTVETPLGPARLKLKRWGGEELGGAPEYEDCARIAREQGLPLREVYRVVVQTFDSIRAEGYTRTSG
jgi:uncharacterized protein (DUF111 family)